MKLKKILSTVVASVLSVSAVATSASAYTDYKTAPSTTGLNETGLTGVWGPFANTDEYWKGLASFSAVPIPTDDEEAFANAQAFYDQGLYYQAKISLAYININNPDNYVNGYKRIEFEKKVDYQIARWEVSQGLQRVRDAIAASNYRGAWNELTDVMFLDYTMDEWYDICALRDFLVDLDPFVRVVRDGGEAIRAVRNAVAREGWNPITSEHEWYTYADVSPFRIDVYVVTDVFGEPKDVAGFQVDTLTGVVYDTFYSIDGVSQWYDGGSYDVFTSAGSILGDNTMFGGRPVGETLPLPTAIKTY